MNKASSYAVMTVGAFGISLALGGDGPRTAMASPTSTVIVANGPSSPVPVAWTTPGAVNAAQSGAWSVGIAGTPTVAVGAMPPVTGTVGLQAGTTVASDPSQTVTAQPLPWQGTVGVWATDGSVVDGKKAVAVIDVTRAQHPFTQDLTVDFAGTTTNQARSGPLTIPAHERAVVEHMSCWGFFTSGKQILRIGLWTENPDSPATATFYAAPNKTGTNVASDVYGPVDHYTVSFTGPLYVEPGGSLYVDVMADSASGLGTWYCGVSGYLVDAP